MRVQIPDLSFENLISNVKDAIDEVLGDFSTTPNCEIVDGKRGPMEIVKPYGVMADNGNGFPFLDFTKKR